MSSYYRNSGPQAADGALVIRDKQRRENLYRPLRHAKDFRLLLLEPRDKYGFDDIHISLYTYNVDEAPSYGALSYAWGDPHDTRAIFVNGRSTKVTRSLYTALLRLRQETMSTRLWVDAICINQEDDDEKTHQVQQMRDIYAKAKTVMSWAGEEDEMTPLVFKAIAYFADRWELGDQYGSNRLEVVGHSVDALRAFFNRPYFQRVWVIQEIAVAKKATISCGYHSIRLEKFQSACEWLRRRTFNSSRTEIPQTPWILGATRSLLQQIPDQCDLLSLLGTTRRYLASDPRDKVFALLGMANLHGDARLATDYSKSVRDVYVSVANRIILASGDLKMLSYVQNNQNSLRLPSWIPDWSHRWLEGSLLRPDGEFAGDYRASGLTKTILNEIWDPYILSLPGFCLDRIKRIYNVRDTIWSADMKTPFLHEQIMYDLVQKLGLGDRYTFTNERYPLAMFKTLTANLVKNKSEIPAKLSDYKLAVAVRFLKGRLLFVTEQGYVGIGYPHILVGDLVCILLGASVPHVLRERRHRNEYHIIGDCYVHGIMYGEAMQGVTKDAFEDFHLR